MNQIFFGCTEPTEEQLTAAGIPFEVHIYEDGPHGLSIGKRELKYGQQKRRKYDGTDSSAFGCMSLVPSVRMGIMGSSALHIRRKALSLR